MTKEEKAQLVYECLGCGERISFEQFRGDLPFKCPKCQYKVFKKVRPPIAKTVKAP